MAKKNFNILMVAALVLFFIAGSIIAGISVDSIRTKEIIALKNDSSSLKNELTTTKNELETTKENLLVETEKTTKLNKSLQNTCAELENVKAELEIANTTIADLKSEEHELVYVGNFRYTYYCDERYEHICGYGKGLTASGKPTEVGWTVAADTSVLPMGSIVYVEGLGFREVMDRGGGVNGNHIDILLPTHNECFKQSLVSGGIWILIKKGS